MTVSQSRVAFPKPDPSTTGKFAEWQASTSLCDGNGKEEVGTSESGQRWQSRG